jgi:hypothetical protein
MRLLGTSRPQTRDRDIGGDYSGENDDIKEVKKTEKEDHYYHEDENDNGI